MPPDDENIQRIWGLTCTFSAEPPSRRGAILAFLVMALGGCSEGRRAEPIVPVREAAGPPLIDAGSTVHHFGAVVSNSGRKLVHRYRLKNATDHDVRIVDVVNRKPCCGEIAIGKAALRPGESTDVEVKLAIRQEFGEVVHEAVVVTEPPRPEELILRTMASAHPALRVEEISGPNGHALLSSSQPSAIAFRVFACGSKNDPIPDLDHISLNSTLKVEWMGPTEPGGRDDGLTFASRRFQAWMDPSGALGQHTAEVSLKIGDQVRYRQPVSWETIAPITASPKLIVLRPNQREHRILIQSRDRRMFRITKIECGAPGVHGRSSPNAALVQTIEIDCDAPPKLKDGRGAVIVHTDHPARAKLEIPLVTID